MSEARPPNTPPRKPPPPPPRRGGPSQASISDGDKEAITVKALGLLKEQVDARIVHYKGELETSPELDAITAQVVAQLRELQSALGKGAGGREDPSQIEAKQIATLARLLKRVCSDDRSAFITHNLKAIGRRIAKLFFESELHEKTKGDKEKRIHHPEQGVYYVLQRYKNRLRAELEGFEYTSSELRETTLELLAKTERDLQVAFLSRRSPELNRVMAIFAKVLSSFFEEHLPPRVEQMAKLTIRNAATARQQDSVSYKVLPERFQAFREQWERLLMEQMVYYCEDELLGQLTGGSEEFLEETVKFFTDPHVFAETCEVLCDALYDFLCLEGFLDLPVDWRVKITRDSP